MPPTAKFLYHDSDQSPQLIHCYSAPAGAKTAPTPRLADTVLDSPGPTGGAGAGAGAGSGRQDDDAPGGRPYRSKKILPYVRPTPPLDACHDAHRLSLSPGPCLTALAHPRMPDVTCADHAESPVCARRRRLRARYAAAAGPNAPLRPGPDPGSGRATSRGLPASRPRMRPRPLVSRRRRGLASTPSRRASASPTWRLRGAP